MNKKGAEMAISTIVIIIMALVVLVVLIYGFSTGWGNLWEKIIGYGGGKVNVQSVIDSCKIACTTTAEYDYCYKTRDVIVKSGDKSVPMTCCQLSSDPANGLSCGNLGCCNVPPKPSANCETAQQKPPAPPK